MSKISKEEAGALFKDLGNIKNRIEKAVKKGKKIYKKVKKGANDTNKFLKKTKMASKLTGVLGRDELTKTLRKKGYGGPGGKKTPKHKKKKRTKLMQI